MRKSRRLTKYVLIVALAAIITFMVGCPSETNEPVSVTDITITGAGDVVEVGNGNTLQMTADILPTGATDASVTWSVVAGTGTATISTTGLLTATGVGTVTVKAVANDDSLIEGTLVITITTETIVSSMASYTAVTLVQTGDVANSNVQYVDAPAVIAALPTLIAVTLEDSSVKDVPITWADTDTYNAAIAADYTFTATWGTLPLGADNDNALLPPTVELTVEAGVILVDSIIVSSEGDVVEVVLDETLQMYAAVLPIDAADATYTWSVVPGTGTATIALDGILTGTGEGTVTVKALANDGSAVEGTMEITVNSRPSMTSEFPVADAIDIAINTNIEATFSEMMDPGTIVPLNFTVSTGGVEIAGIVTYDVVTKTATFNPDADLLYSTVYTATVTSDVTDLAGLNMSDDHIWSFTTVSEVLAGTGPAAINLKTASNFAILAKAAITTTGDTFITGDIGVSPQALVDLTGFSETLSLDETYATSIYVSGKIYAADMQEPTPSTLTTAISDVEAAYTEAAGRSDVPVTAEAYSGIIGGQTFVPGIYKWDTGVTMATDIIVQGGPNDTWVFQIAGNLTLASGAIVTLADGAQAKNIFWQVGEIATLGTGAHLEGVLMSMTQIILETGASVHGKLLAQTQVTLDTAEVTPL